MFCSSRCVDHVAFMPSASFVSLVIAINQFVHSTKHTNTALAMHVCVCICFSVSEWKHIVKNGHTICDSQKGVFSEENEREKPELMKNEQKNGRHSSNSRRLVKYIITIHIHIRANQIH